MIYRIVYGLIGATYFLAMKQANAQDLPYGVGAYRVGTRNFNAITESYDSNGQRQGIGSRLNKDFSGAAILNSNDGSDLYRLASELAQFEDQQAGGTYADRLKLGQLRGDVRADIKSQFVGVAFGLPKKMWIFAGIPYVTATVDTKLVLGGENNAMAIRNELGDLAYDELQSGLAKAANFGVQDVHSAIAGYGYQPLGRWSAQGVGDARFGAGKAFSQGLGSGGLLSQKLALTAIIPTGYVERPDILTDISFGGGGYELQNDFEINLDTRKGLLFGLGLTYGWTLSTERDVRVPQANETLIDESRTSSVQCNPGDNTSFRATAAFNRNWWTIGTGIEFSKHFRDRYNGKLVGNYEALGKNSASQKLEHRMVLSGNSIEEFQKRRFPVPVIVELTAARLISARNDLPKDYYEFSLTSFFDARTKSSSASKNTKGKSRIASN